MLPTPDLSHRSKEDIHHVYDPAEDTFLLLDALEKDAETLRALQPRICLEIGSGSGCVSSFMGAILGPSNTLYLCTDINSHATRLTTSTGTQNKIPLNAILGSLAQPLRSRLNHSVDVMMFNPPYVPTVDEEVYDAQSGRDIEGSWAGGADGMQVTNRLLEDIEHLLSPKGRFYLVAVKDNDVPGIRSKMLDKYDLQSEITLQRRAGREYLFIVCFFRAPTILATPNE